MGDVLANHAALKAELGKGWYDEHAALERLLELPRLPANLIARIRTGTATMADAKELVAMQEWGDERVHSDHRGAGGVAGLRGSEGVPRRCGLLTRL